MALILVEQRADRHVEGMLDGREGLHIVRQFAEGVSRVSADRRERRVGVRQASPLPHHRRQEGPTGQRLVEAANHVADRPAVTTLTEDLFLARQGALSRRELHPARSCVLGQLVGDAREDLQVGQVGLVEYPTGFDREAKEIARVEVECREHETTAPARAPPRRRSERLAACCRYRREERCRETLQQSGPAEAGGWALASIGLFNIVGAIAAGWLAAFMPKRYILSLIYFGRAMAILVYILLPPSTVVTLIFGAAMGLFWLSTVPPTSGLVAVMFGTRWLAMLFGFAFFSHQVGGFLGVWLGGVLFERTGSYDAVWWLSILLGLLSAAINLPIVEKPVVRPTAVPA